MSMTSAKVAYDRIDCERLVHDKRYEEEVYRKYGYSVVAQSHILWQRYHRRYLEVRNDRLYDGKYFTDNPWNSPWSEFEDPIEPKPKKGSNAMNLSTAVFLINDQVRGVLATYEPDTNIKKSDRIFLKTMDPTIKIGDNVVVSTTTRHNRTVMKIVEVDVEPDFDDSTIIEWVISKVDEGTYAKLTAMEEEAKKVIASAEKRKKREELAAAIKLDQNDKIKALPIYTAPKVD
jgi:hypothetical protein